jgi:hypothetical protein
MDTTFWGPDGHMLNHSIAYCYTFGLYDNIPKKIINSFFKSEKYVLPCIYCRRSYSKYIKELPIKSEENIFKWMYKIHNKINNKLRKQGYLKIKNPSYNTILKKYKRFVKKIDCDMIGWNFLYSIVFEYPQYDFELSNTRYNGYITFFTNLKYLLPSENIREIYKKYIEKNPVQDHMKSRESLKKWLYKLEKKLKKKCQKYKERCDKIEVYRVKKCKNKSCRK